MAGFTPDLVGYGTKKRCDPSYCHDPPLGTVEGIPRNPAEFTEAIDKMTRGDEEISS